ncbi:MAG: ABC transporter substrate-binding protein [Patescibacteria group bacterium]|nr:ABC transporter substrate-binding protein [Patescibacteria group bacterium]
MKKLIIVLLVVLLAAGFFFFLKKNDYQIFGISLKSQKNIKTGKTYKIGVVMTGGAYQQALDGLKKGLEEKGFREGKNIFFIIKDTRGNTDALASSIEELIAEKPDVIYSTSTPVTTQASKSVGDKIPIVFNIVGDPIGAGFARNYSMPETNLTGCSNLSAELSGKRLEIFKETFPNIKKTVTFFNPENKFSQIAIENLRKAAPILGVEVAEIIVKDKDALNKALAGIAVGQFDGIYITPDAMVVSNADLIVKKSLELKIPTMGHEQTLAEKGVTLTYGANFYDMGVQCSSVMASVISGQKPQVTPILTPDKFDIVVNQKNLDAMGISIESKILKEADKVIR